MSFPSYSINRDRKVKVLANGTPVSASTAASVYAKYLNFLGSNFSIAENNTLGTFDVTLTGLATPNKLIPKLNNTQVASTARNINFDNTQFNIAENVGNDNYDFSLKYPGRVFSNVNTTTPRKLNFGSNITAAENVGADTIDISVPVQSSVSPVTSKKWGVLMGGVGSSSTSTKVGTGFMENWNIAGTMIPDADADGTFAHFTTGTTSGNVASYSGDSATGYLNPIHNPTFWFKVKVPVITSTRMYFGIYDNPLPTNAYNYLNSHKGVGIMFDSGAFTKWQMEHNNSLATNTVTDTGVTVTAGTVYTFKIFCDNANTRWGVTVNNGSPIYTTSNIPQLSGWTYGAIANFQTMTSSARDMYLYYEYGETDL